MNAEVPPLHKVAAATSFFCLCGAIAGWSIWYALAYGWVYVGGWHNREHSPVFYWLGTGLWGLTLLGALGFVGIGVRRLWFRLGAGRR